MLLLLLVSFKSVTICCLCSSLPHTSPLLPPAPIRCCCSFPCTSSSSVITLLLLIFTVIFMVIFTAKFILLAVAPAFAHRATAGPARLLQPSLNTPAACGNDI
jgi:hypothetical protein